jgi:hypothetical protein
LSTSLEQNKLLTICNNLVDITKLVTRLLELCAAAGLPEPELRHILPEPELEPELENSGKNSGRQNYEKLFHISKNFW